MPSEIETLDDVITRSGPGRALDMIGAYVVRQRWSGAIGRSVTDVRIVDAVRVEGVETPLYFTVTHVALDDGTSHDYALPLGHRPAGDPLAERAPDFVIGGLPGDGPARFLYDALGDPEYVLWLWRAVHREETLRTATGTLRFTVFDRESLDPDLDPPLRVLGIDQSNTSLLVGDETFLKHVRRVDPGPSQELEMLSALRRAGFTQLAAPQAAVLYEPAGALPSPLVLVQPFLHNGTEGWTLALTSLRSLYAAAEEVAFGDDEAQREAIDEHGADFAPEAARMGSVVAEMHAALAQPGLGDDFTPQPVTAADLARWSAEMNAELDALLARPDAVLDILRRNRHAVTAVFDAVAALQPSGLRMRVHGDLHLGQTLRTDSGWVVLDFEGEPDRSPAQRRRLTSPLVDVAGMLRSFDYAAAVALAERILPESADWEGMLAFGEAWSGACREAFWSAYVEGAAASGLLPDSTSVEVLRRAFEMQKAVYETAYELGHRPTWATIPIRFLLGGAA